ncbi:MAG: L-iditol 2-dehydrogenase [Gaiellaceae bacterium]|jgi:L-iditol 2-dehydrogenase|nr:L-iditol 2-dehydrogenase [Gaiellaceae bacterium]MDX6620410.1 L-iditol 2-dehydrogenase [Gaiellales bacterium]
MKALVFEEPRNAVVSDVDMPAITADEVLVRSRNVGICHSDFELYEGRYIIPVAYPIIPGHEWAGEIAEVGGDVATLRPGDRVVGECVVNNGDDHFGFSISGADAEYFVAKASWLHHIPEELSFTQGAFVEPFSVAYSAAVAAGGIDASDEVAVIGGGPIGLLCAMAASAMGGAVTLIEPQAHRRALGLDIGAQRAIDPSAGTLSEQVAEVTQGRGFDVVIEAAGAPAAMASAFPLAALGGRVVLVGIDIGGTVDVEIGLVQSKALQVRGIIGSAGLWPRTIRFMATSGVDPTPLLTATFPLLEGAAALEAARDTSRNVKVQIEC